MAESKQSLQGALRDLKHVYIISLYGQGDAYYHIITKAQYDGWPDGLDPLKYTLQLEESVDMDDTTFTSVKDLVVYLKEHNLEIVDEVSGDIY